MGELKEAGDGNTSVINPYLSTATRWVSVLFGIFLIFVGLILLTCPPQKTTEEICNPGYQKTKVEDKDVTSATVVLLVTGVGLVLFGLNGLRFSKFQAWNISTESPASSATPATIEGLPQEEMAALQNNANPPPSKYGLLPEPAKKVLRTLWKYQCRQFSEDSKERWGFSVYPPAPDHYEFKAGAEALKNYGLALVDLREMAFLTDSGMAFCKGQRKVIEADGPTWDKFGP